MESLDKFSAIPIIESGIKTGMTIYNRVKRTNRLVNWGFETSENVAFSVIESVRPAVKFIEGPLERVDKIGMKVLECVEGESVNFSSSLYPVQFFFVQQKKSRTFIFRLK